MEKPFNEKVITRLEQIDFDLNELLKVEGSLTELRTVPDGMVPWAKTTIDNVNEFIEQLKGN